jgi:hypothetical protein
MAFYHFSVYISCLCSYKGCGWCFQHGQPCRRGREHHSEEKGKKAAQAIKLFDALFEEVQKAQKTPVTEPADTDK